MKFFSALRFDLVTFDQGIKGGPHDLFLSALGMLLANGGK